MIAAKDPSYLVDEKVSVQTMHGFEDDFSVSGFVFVINCSHGYLVVSLVSYISESLHY